jgi:hypothetical protein
MDDLSTKFPKCPPNGILGAEGTLAHVAQNINVWQTIDVNKMMIADLKYMADHRC